MCQTCEVSGPLPGNDVRLLGTVSPNNIEFRVPHEVIAIPHISIAGEAEGAIGDAPAGCGELDLVVARAHPRILDKQGECKKFETLVPTRLKDARSLQPWSVAASLQTRPETSRAHYRASNLSLRRTLTLNGNYNCSSLKVPSVQWDKLFTFTTSPLELFIRGTFVYLFILVLMRVLRREPGTVGIADLLMVVLIADASQNAMAGEYQSVLDGIVLILTIVFWNFFMDWLTLRSQLIEGLTYPPPISLFEHTKMNRTNMRKQFVTQAQLLGMMREHGIDDLSKVKAIFIEGSGHVSVIPGEDDERRRGHEDDRRKQNIK
jgi:uncharacterized membrane protein YcaP (DUF421 family)